MSTQPRYAPSWASGLGTQPAPDVPTQFEQLVAACGLTGHPELWTDSTRLRAFAKRNRHIRYVPESYLEALGLDVEDGL